MDTFTRTAPSSRRRKVTGAALLAAGGAALLASVVFPANAGADPRGNNGTIKIDGVALQVGQANEPHVDCRFAIEFFGYDNGDLNASVTFSLQAPTRRPSGTQVLRTDLVPIGEDPAGGAVDLDASREYELDFTGVAPHPQQGYHVKATIHAAGSQGADTKHKVFWVQPCAAPTTTTTTTTVPVAPTTVTTLTPTTPTTLAIQGATTTTQSPQVLGEQVERSQLPRTGAGVNTLALLGGLALLIGGLISFTSRPGPGRLA
jgi:LPXTG-motif cell wall-anchored protein